MALQATNGLGPKDKFSVAFIGIRFLSEEVTIVLVFEVNFFSFNFLIASNKDFSPNNFSSVNC